jgi:hypothetical protein
MKDKKQVWVVGKFICEVEPMVSAWELQGVFDTENDAIGVCRSERYFIGPVIMNEPLPDETYMWPGAYYPRGENE